MQQGSPKPRKAPLPDRGGLAAFCMGASLPAATLGSYYTFGGIGPAFLTLAGLLILLALLLGWNA